MRKRREAILRAALHVFGRRGFHGAQMEEVAQEAGVGKGTLYHHFESKEVLLREAILYLIEQHERQLRERLAQAESVVEKLYQVVYTDYDFSRSHAPMVRVVVRESAAVGFSSSFRESMLALRRRHNEEITRLMAQGQEAGVLRADIPVDLLALAFVGMGKELCFDILFAEEPARDPGEVARSLVTIFLDRVATGTFQLPGGEGRCPPVDDGVSVDP